MNVHFHETRFFSGTDFDMENDVCHMLVQPERIKQTTKRFQNCSTRNALELFRMQKSIYHALMVVGQTMSLLLLCIAIWSLGSMLSQ